MESGEIHEDAVPLLQEPTSKSTKVLLALAGGPAHGLWMVNLVITWGRSFGFCPVE